MTLRLLAAAVLLVRALPLLPPAAAPASVLATMHGHADPRHAAPHVPHTADPALEAGPSAAPHCGAAPPGVRHAGRDAGHPSEDGGRRDAGHGRDHACHLCRIDELAVLPPLDSPEPPSPRLAEAMTGLAAPAPASGRHQERPRARAPPQA